MTTPLKLASNRSNKDPQISTKYKRKKKAPENVVSVTEVSAEGGKPSHHIMSSLALLAANNPTAINELTKTSVDMRSQRELDRLQKVIQQKETQFLSALEIADNLNITNTKLKNQCANLEEQLSTLQSEYQILQMKATAVEDRYEKEIQQLQSSLDEHSQMVVHLQEDLLSKEKTLQLVEQQQLAQLKEKFNNGETLTSLDGTDYTPATISGDSQATSRKNEAQELRKQLNEEMKRSDEWLKERNQLYDKLDEMAKIAVAYDKLQQQHKQLQRSLQDEVAQYQEASKTISREIVVLAAQNSRLEQRVEELQTELGQRNHEIELLSQVNVIQTRQLRHGAMVSDQGVFQTTEMDDLAGLTMTSGDNTFMLAQLDDGMEEATEEDHISDREEEEEEEEQYEGVKEDTKTTSTKTGGKTMSEKDKDDFVADVIKEYLHLSASSVKIKFPLVTTISNEALIEQTKHLPFYQYHDFMVRIMEKEIKRMDDEKKKKLDSQRPKSPIDTMQKSASRRSLLGNFFGLFGAKEDGKNTEDGTNDNNEEDIDSETRQDGKIGSPQKGHKHSNSYGDGVIKQSMKQQETKKATAPTSAYKRETINMTSTHENIEQILDDMDLDGIFNDEDLGRGDDTQPTTDTAAVESSTSTKHKRGASNDRTLNTTTKTDPNSENSQTRRTARSVFTRALSRR